MRPLFRLYAAALPWKPKVHRRDIEEYLSVSRKKFVGYRLEDDLESMAGLPHPILEGRSILDKVGSRALGWAAAPCRLDWDAASLAAWFSWTGGSCGC